MLFMERILAQWHVFNYRVSMELSDRIFYTNHDWDPQYLRELVCQDFYEFQEHWQSSLGDKELIAESDRAMATEQYTPLMEDISLDDDTLYEAVSQIEREYVCLA